MPFRILPCLVGILFLAGCSSQKTATPTSGAQTPTTGTTTSPSTTPAPKNGSTPLTSGPTPRGDAYAKGIAYLKQRSYGAAQSQFKVAVARHQHLPQAYLALGRAAQARRDYAVAFAAFTYAVRANPKNASNVYSAAYNGLYARNYRVSLIYATRYIQLRPKDANGYHLRFLNYSATQKASKQLPDARKVVKLSPSATAYNDLGIALANNRKYKEAAATFGQAIKRSPKTASFYTNRALAENLSRQPELAMRDLQQALSMVKDPASKQMIQHAIAVLKTHIKH